MEQPIYRTVGAVRYLFANGVNLSSEGLRKAENRKEIVAIHTTDGSRLFTQSALDDFIARRNAKKIARSQSKEAA